MFNYSYIHMHTKLLYRSQNPALIRQMVLSHDHEMYSLISAGVKQCSPGIATPKHIPLINV